MPVRIRSLALPILTMRCWSCLDVLAGPSSRRSRVQIPHSALPTRAWHGAVLCGRSSRPASCDRGRMVQAAAFQAALCGFDSRRSLQVVGGPLQGTRRAGGNGNRAGLENHGPASRPVGVRILCPPHSALRSGESCTSTIAPWVMAARRALTPVCPRSNRGGRATNRPRHGRSAASRRGAGAARKGRVGRSGLHSPGWCSGSTRGSDPRRATFESSTGSNSSTQRLRSWRNR